MENIKTYSVKEAEQILHVKRRTICDYIKDGKLKAAKIGRGFVIKETDLLDFINKRA